MRLQGWLASLESLAETGGGNGSRIGHYHSVATGADGAPSHSVDLASQFHGPTFREQPKKKGAAVARHALFPSMFDQDQKKRSPIRMVSPGATMIDGVSSLLFSVVSPMCLIQTFFLSAR